MYRQDGRPGKDRDRDPGREMDRSAELGAGGLWGRYSVDLNHHLITL